MNCGKTSSSKPSSRGLCFLCEADGPPAGTGDAGEKQEPLTGGAADPLTPELDARIDALDAERTETRRAWGAGELSPGQPWLTVMAEQDRTLNGLRAFCASNPAAVLPPAIVDDLGGVESYVEHAAWAVGVLHPDSFGAVDWRGICGDLRRSVEAHCEARQAEIAGWLAAWLGQCLSIPMRLAPT